MRDLLDYLNDLADFLMTFPATGLSPDEKQLLQSLKHNADEKYEKTRSRNPDKNSPQYRETINTARKIKRDCKKLTAQKITINEFICNVKNFLIEIKNLLDTDIDGNISKKYPGFFKEIGV
jgi:hypothetical protein